MKSVPFLLYSFVLVLTFIPVVVIGGIAELISYFKRRDLRSRQKQETDFAEYAIQ